MDKEKLEKALDDYKKDMSSYEKGVKEHKERTDYYQSFTAERISKMLHEDFYEYIGKLWSMLIWGNKTYIIDKIISDNGLENLKESLILLLYGKEEITHRWDTFSKNIKGMGAATISELLSHVYPEKFAILNKTTILTFEYLGLSNLPIYNYQKTGKKYLEICEIAKEIATVMKEKGFEKVTLLTIDYFLWDALSPLADKKEKNNLTAEKQPEKINNQESISIHNEVQDKIVEIGELLGFKSNKEVKVATGAIVDAVWEVQIGNMGKVIYVFEVQTKGSIDSLILNLTKAQKNTAVQAVVAVSDSVQLEKICNESINVISEKTFRTWDCEDVLEVYDSLTRAHESINKLALVPISFVK